MPFPQRQNTLGPLGYAFSLVTDILVPQLKHIENKQDATLEEVTQLRNDLDLHTRMATVERQVQHLKKVNQDIPAP